MNGGDWPNVDRSVQDALKTILSDEGFETDAKLDVSRGSDSGDGYASKTYAITVADGERRLELFVKYFPLDGIHHKGVIIKLFDNEGTFYSDVFPALERFQAERNVEEPFDNVPKYFRCGETTGAKPVVLENLKSRGYDLRQRRDQIDEEHLTLALKTFGKFHAATFALKDQEYETFARVTDGITDVLAEAMAESGFDKVLESCIGQFVENLDPAEDEDLLRSSDGLASYLVDFVKNIARYRGEYCTLLQGDCWSNNMMFLYKNTKKPADIKLIDWQIARVNYPVFDLSYFFYSVATSEMLKNWEHYARIYHGHFSEHCRSLGSDPDRLYPFEVLRDHWRKYSKYGFAMAFMLVKVMLYEKDEAPDLAKSLEKEEMDAELFNNKMRHQDVYDRRMKDIFRHFIENKFI